MLVKDAGPRESRLGLFIVAGLVAALLIGVGAVASDVAALADRELLWSLIYPPEPEIAAASGDVDPLYLSIDWEDLGKLERQRDEALERGVLITGADDFVPARLAVGSRDRWSTAKVRLKGDWTEHLEGRHWSFRVKLRGEGRLFGMKTFSLQHPRHRGGVHGWLYHQVLRREEILALRYRFVRLQLNDADLGVYAVEEHFDRRLIEDNGFRDGPILRIDEGLHWQLVAEDDLSPPIRSLEQLSDIRPYSAPRIATEGPFRAAFVRAASLLEGVRGGSVAAGEAFDVAKTARYYALCDLTGAHHGITWANQRFYFNPLTGRLEPIGFDADAGQAIPRIAFELGEGFEPLWRDEGFRHAYLGELERFAAPDYLDDLLGAVGPELARNQAILEPGTETSARELFAVYRTNQQVIRKVLEPLRALRAHRAPAPVERPVVGRPAAAEPDSITLEVVSLSPLPLEVLGLTLADGRRLQLDEPAVLRRWTPGPVRVDPVVFALDPKGQGRWVDTAGAELQYRIAGTRTLRAEAVLPWPAPRSELVPPDLLRPDSSPESRPFLERSPDGGLRIRPGEWTIERDLVVPAGPPLQCGPGVTLDLVQGASVLSYAPLDFRGSSEEPIVIHSSDRTGHGLLVLDAGAESTLVHVHFADLSAPRGQGWAMTGAVTFYQSPVTIRNGFFTRNHTSDDALNVFRSELEVEDTRFYDLPADAIDVDFGSGAIRGCDFERISGDAVDVSGSRLTLARTKVRDVGDKALSVGEMSHLRFFGLDVARARMGVVSKDDSTVEGRDLTLLDSDVGFAAFRKKVEYGPAAISVYSYRAENVSTLYQLETGSTLTLDSETLPANAENLRERYYPGGAAE